MKRTQIYLSDAEHAKIKEYAHKHKQSISASIREMTTMVLSDSPIKKKKQKSFGEEMLENRRKFSFNGPADLSTTIDDYLYRGKKP